MINSVSQSPAFGQKVFLYVKGDAEKAAKAVKGAFGDKVTEIKRKPINEDILELVKREQAAIDANGGKPIIKKAAKLKPVAPEEPIPPFEAGVNKFMIECENWGKAERDLLWDKLIGRRVVEEVAADGKKAKKVVYDDLPTFVSMG